MKISRTCFFDTLRCAMKLRLTIPGIHFFSSVPLSMKWSLVGRSISDSGPEKSKMRSFHSASHLMRGVLLCVWVLYLAPIFSTHPKGTTGEKQLGGSQPSP